MSSPAATPRRRRRGAVLPTLAIVVVLIIAYVIFTNLWTDRLWFTSLGYLQVFSTMLWTRLALFAVFGVVMGAAVAASSGLAYRMRPRVRRASTGSALLDRYREILETRFIWLMVALGVVVGLFAGVAAGGHAQTYLAWRHATPFGQKDPRFGIDIGFFVFDYPWIRIVASFALTALIFAVVAAAIVHYVTGGLRIGRRGRGSSPAAQAQLSILLGLAVLIRGVQYWFDQYGLELSRSTGLLTGLTYTNDHITVNAKLILSIIAGICALIFFTNAVIRRWAIPIVGLVLLVLSGLLLGAVYPAAYQQISVKPDEADKEKAYIADNIKATRQAYGVDNVQVTDYAAKTTASQGQLRADAAALPGIRLIDPSVENAAFEQLQQIRGYYSFPQLLDVDRYQVDGQSTDAVVAVREIDPKGLQDRNWINLHTVYTHGYGLVAAYANRATSDGQPDWFAENIPPTGALSEHEPRIYFGEQDNDYAIVGAKPNGQSLEFDTPGGGKNGAPQTYTYQGKGGVPIGSAFNRVLYASKFVDWNILLSDRIDQNSKILYDRTPQQRVKAAAPWLTLDQDAYPAVVQGRIVWIVDGYTTSDYYPNSERTNLTQATSDSLSSEMADRLATPDNVNYMRNAVKAVVDAYDGTVTLYAWDESDPVLQTWERVFPNTVQPKSAIPSDLLAHLRYPQDLFKVQRSILARYHVTDPAQWYAGNDLWDIPDAPNSQPSTSPQNGTKESPYYLSIKWPGDDDAQYSLTTTYVPHDRSNLAAYMAVDADATSPDYGQIRILRMSDTTQIDGPEQTANAFTSSPVVAEALRNFQNTGSSAITYGNLLTLPVGGGLLYVEPIYTQKNSGGGTYPAMTFVAARFGQTIGLGTTLQQALDQVFAGDAGVSTGEGGGTAKPGTAANNPAAAAALQRANQDYADAQTALKKGDLATYQKKVDQAQQEVETALKALGAG